MLLSLRKKGRVNRKSRNRNKDKSYLDSYEIEKPVELELKEEQKEEDQEKVENNIVDPKLPNDNYDENKYRSNNLIVKFSKHIEEYVGQTVTIFTSSGGESGSGFTGVILSADEAFIRILIKPGPAPECSLGNYNSDFNNPLHSYMPLHNWNYIFRNYYDMIQYNFRSYLYNSNLVNNSRLPTSSLGSIADIRTKHITAFVHNAV